MKISLSLVCLVGATALLAAAPADAQSAAELSRLSACVEKIDTDPEGAFEDGLAWRSEGDRPGARQCVALALVALGQEGEGAVRLEELANAPDSGGLEARAVYLAQAGNAWMLADAPEAAVVAFTNAIKLAPRDGELRKDRARAYITMKAWTEAGKDLDAAAEFSPGDAEALHMRARVLVQQDRLDDAWHDIVAAMAQAPADISILVTRGEIREAMRLKGMPDPAGLE